MANPGRKPEVSAEPVAGTLHFALNWHTSRVADVGRVLAAGGWLLRADLHTLGYLRMLCTMARRRGCDARFR